MVQDFVHQQYVLLVCFLWLFSRFQNPPGMTISYPAHILHDGRNPANQQKLNSLSLYPTSLRLLVFLTSVWTILNWWFERISEPSNRVSTNHGEVPLLRGQFFHSQSYNRGCWSLPIFDPAMFKAPECWKRGGRRKDRRVTFSCKILNKVVGNNWIVHMIHIQLWRF